MKNRLRVDFHCHTVWSSDSFNSTSKILRFLKQNILERLVITDHNTLEGALKLKEKDPEHIIVGEEIQTSQGEVLAAFVTQEIPKGLPPYVVIDRLRAQGAFISLSHPYDIQRSPWQEKTLKDMVKLVDAIEVFNARVYRAEYNEQALAFAKAYGLAGTVGTDAHLASELGGSWLELPDFSSAEELRQVISIGIPNTHLSPVALHMGSGFASLLNKAGLKRKL